MYSFALFDIKKEILILSRDIFGIKPLYTLEAEKIFWFSSQPFSFVKSGLLKRELSQSPKSRNKLDDAVTVRSVKPTNIESHPKIFDIPKSTSMSYI